MIYLSFCPRRTLRLNPKLTKCPLPFYKYVVETNSSTKIPYSRLILAQQPGKEVDLRCDRDRLNGALTVSLANNSGAVPFEESVQHFEGCVQCDFKEPASLVLRFGLLVGSGGANISGIGDNLGQFREIEHNFRNGALACCPSSRDPAENVTQGDETNEPLAVGSENGKLVKSLLTH